MEISIKLLCVSSIIFFFESHPVAPAPASLQRRVDYPPVPSKTLPQLPAPSKVTPQATAPSTSNGGEVPNGGGGGEVLPPPPPGSSDDAFITVRTVDGGVPVEGYQVFYTPKGEKDVQKFNNDYESLKRIVIPQGEYFMTPWKRSLNGKAVKPVWTSVYVMPPRVRSYPELNTEPFDLQVPSLPESFK